MKIGDKALTPQISFTDTKDQIESRLNLVRGMEAITTDTDETGFYNGSVWIWGQGGSGSVAASGIVYTEYVFGTDGSIVPLSGVGISYVVNRDAAISGCYIHCGTLGTASNTIVDINKNGTSVFTNQANRPSLAWNDSNGWAYSFPDNNTITPGDIITLDIDSVASGAGGLSVSIIMAGSGLLGGGGGTSTFNLHVGDYEETQNIGRVSRFVFSGLPIVNNGEGVVTITSPVDDAYVLLRDVKSNGTSGGVNASNTWTKRTINTEVIDTGNICSISSSQITLQAGTYDTSIVAPFFSTGITTIRLRNVTDSATTLQGISYYAYQNAMCHILGRFTITSAKTFEIQYIAQNIHGDGLGTQVGGYLSNFTETEVYTTAEFWKVA